MWFLYRDLRWNARTWNHWNKLIEYFHNAKKFLERLSKLPQYKAWQDLAKIVYYRYDNLMIIDLIHEIYKSKHTTWMQAWESQMQLKWQFRDLVIDVETQRLKIDNHDIQRFKNTRPWSIEFINAAKEIEINDVPGMNSITKLQQETDFLLQYFPNLKNIHLVFDCDSSLARNLMKKLPQILQIQQIYLINDLSKASYTYKDSYAINSKNGWALILSPDEKWLVDFKQIKIQFSNFSKCFAIQGDYLIIYRFTSLLLHKNKIIDVWQDYDIRFEV